MVNPTYNDLYDTATRLISEWGKAVQIQRRTKTGGPQHNPTYSYAILDCQFVETENSLTNRGDTLIEQDDIFGIVSMQNDAGADTTLNDDDKIVIDGREYSRVKFKPLNPGGLQLLTEIHVR